MCQNNLKIYGGFVQAFRQKWEGLNIITDINTWPIIVKAYDLDKALGIAYRYSKKAFPTKKGYYNHSSDVVEEK